MLLLIFLLMTVAGLSQLNCKESMTQTKESVKMCYHQNRKKSTVETWDKDHRFGTFTGYDTNEKQLFNYHLRAIGGHAYVSVNYYPNGQVSRVEYSEAPDGGIQFYKSTAKFDEQGKQTDFQEIKHPPELITTVPSPTKVPDKKEQVPQKVAECAVPVMDYFEIVNQTKSKITFRVISKPDFNYASKEFYFTLKPAEIIVFDSLISAQQHPQKSIYEPIIVSYTKKRRYKTLQLIATFVEDKSKSTKIWQWKVINK